jgi:NagD protein
VLVLSGEATAEQATSLPQPPDLIIADIGELGERLEIAQQEVVRE